MNRPGRAFARSTVRPKKDPLVYLGVSHAGPLEIHVNDSLRFSAASMRIGSAVLLLRHCLERRRFVFS